MTEEPEVLNSRLKELKCPYFAGDDRAIVWLDGFQKGYNAAANQAIASANQELERLSGKHQR